MITISYINFWTDPHNDNYFTRFIEENIGPVKKVNHTENPDILIASCMGNINKVVSMKARCKLFYYGENLNRYPPYNDDKLLQRTFDLIVGFKDTDISKKQIRFPLWLLYYKYYSYNENDNILTHIQGKYDENVKIYHRFSYEVSKHWKRCHAKKGAVVAIRYNMEHPKFVTHFGYCINEYKFIHTTKQTGAIVENLSNIQNLIEGFYEYDTNHTA